MQKARGQAGPKATALPLLVGTRFQVLFHSPPGVLFTFPSRYLFTIGHQRVFSLGGWSPRIPTGFLVSRGTREQIKSPGSFIYRTVTFFGIAFQSISVRTRIGNSLDEPNLTPICPTTPTIRSIRAIRIIGLGCSTFARHY